MARAPTRRELLQLGGVAAVAWGGAQFFQRAAPLGRDVSGNLTAQALLLDRESPRLDNPAADLTVVIFTDYQCPACKLSAPALAAAVRRDGRIRLIFKDWPILGPVSATAARVAVAANRQGIYPALHGRLMQERRSLDDAVLQDAVEAAGGNWQRLLADLAAHRTAIDQRIARTGADAMALGIDGTPAFVIGTMLIIGGRDEDGFLDAFAEARAVR
jgi:protein-disulfide isomerase